ncbi:lipoyltransferase [Phlyctema vagabunda]|uniref:Putative lipoate-protein ligase A n=1 Tax=Phlyctema vagabunda TaxID=108571 RepID=A0ABR4PB27_9HELO
MSPSQRLSSLLRATIPVPDCASVSPIHARCYSAFVKAATNPANNSQVYLSRTRDPYLNLSIEHFLLQKTPPESTILFLYTNRPCIIIGRNQNPWLEVNLGLLKAHPGMRDISLVRRRSGGGTVFHDEGNVNYSVICPTHAFDRDRHAEMVVRALQSLGVRKARVNERHDIVLDPSEVGPQPLKISGSAYKLTRLRSVHHGTCLLSSPNIGSISQYLRSPAKPYIKARGVDSVSSPIANANVSTAEFEDAVVSEFTQLYGATDIIPLGDDLKSIPEISTGLAELKSLDWIYSQTPQFTFSTHVTEEDTRPRPPFPPKLPKFNATFTARNGLISQVDVIVPSLDYRFTSQDLKYQLYKVRAWADILGILGEKKELHAICNWLDNLFKNNSRNK